MDDLALVLTAVGAVGAGLVGGALYAFSSFVMPALARLPAGRATAAMQSINVCAPRPGFMVPFVGTALVSVALVVVALVRWGDDGAPHQLAGGLLYLATVVVTGAFHIPRNDALDAVDADGAEAPDRWRTYLREWTAGNHVRTATALAASVVLVLGARA
jgi:uncharacterized membrane protein